MNRYWRMILSERNDLRGSDYGEDDGSKTVIEQNHKMMLGYESAYGQNNSLFSK